ncbi:MAG: ArsB/NhaD family transporter [Spirochaetales bacterium]|jgi:Na+/H+ antiporter NhaD/arsenite permease-like protein|nr:ArsB/NhaD family transporter [Spirochaetales bacterium]
MGILSWTALAIFVAAYLLFLSDKLNRTVVVLTGAALFLILHIVDQTQAFLSIDWNVIFFMIFMMLIIGVTKTTGLFHYIAIKAAKIGQGDPLKILILLSLVGAVFSAFIDNVTTVLILTPVTILIAVELGIPPAPFIICQSIASNIGGTATLIGNPPNLKIGSVAKLKFLSFVGNMGPIVVINLIVFALLVFLLFRRQMTISNERKARIMEFDESKALENKPLLIKSLIALFLVISGFLLHETLNVEAATISLFVAALLLVFSGKNEPEAFLRDIEWGTVFFFIGLFIMVSGLTELGIVGMCADFFIRITEGSLPLTSFLLIWLSALSSALINNIPYVMAMIPIVEDIAADLGPQAAMPLWWSLALGACLGGNATLVGASANVVAASISAQSGYPIRFLDFLKYGLLFTIISLALSTGYVFLRYF